MDTLNQLLERGFNGVMIHHILTLIILIISFFSSLILILSKSGNYRSKPYLSGFFFSIGCIESFLFISSVDDSILGIYALPFIVTFILMLAPLAYLYVKKTTQPNQNPPSRHLFIPLIIGLCIITLIIASRFIASSAINTLINLLLRNTVLLSILIFLPIQVIYYILSMYYLVRQHKKTIAEYFSYQEGINLKWIQFFSLGFSIFIMGCFLFEISESSVDNIFFKIYILIYTSVIAIFGIRQTNIYSDFESDASIRLTTSDSLPKKLASKGVLKQERYAASSLKDAQKIRLIEQGLNNYLLNNEAYLDAKLNLKDVAKELGINYKYLSQVINSKYDCSFIHLVNSYRIEAAKKELRRSKNNRDSIEQIGYLSGFQSKSAFYSNFKKHTGLTPVQFQKSQK